MPGVPSERSADVPISRPERHRRDVAEPHIVAEDQVLELLRRLQARRWRAPTISWLALVSDPGRHVERGSCRAPSRRSATVSPRLASFDLVDVDAEDLLLVAVDLHVGDALDGGEPIGDLVFDKQRQVFHRQRVGRHRQPHDRLAVGVGLDDPRLVGILGQLVAPRGRARRGYRWRPGRYRWYRKIAA